MGKDMYLQKDSSTLIYLYYVPLKYQLPLPHASYRYLGVGHCSPNMHIHSAPKSAHERQTLALMKAAGWQGEVVSSNALQKPFVRNKAK